LDFGFGLALGKNTKSKWPKYKVKYKKYPTEFLHVQNEPGEVPAKREKPLPAIKEPASRQIRNIFPYHYFLPAKSDLN
jgi:hypothetical protein